MPTLNGSRSTVAPCALGDAGGLVGRRVVDDDDVAVRSKARISSTTRADRALLVPARDDATSRAGHASDPGLEPDELEQPSCAVRVRVLVEDALARAPPHLLGLRRVGDELAVRRDGLLRALDDDELAPRLEPALDPLVRVRDDRRTRRRELERARTSTSREPSRAAVASC